MAFDTTNKSLRELLGNGTAYRIPPFQRDYSWRAEEWRELWLDLDEVLADASPAPLHYMGYLVLLRTATRQFDVVDGQQRLTTLSLLVLAVIEHLQDLMKAGVLPSTETARVEELRRTFIGGVDLVTLTAEPKLTLNRNNNDLYQLHLVPGLATPRRGLSASEKLLKEAYGWLCAKVRSRFAKVDSGAPLSEFVAQVSDRLLFTVITVDDELNAFRVFETLNARGVRLSPTDLLKNHLFSVVFREDRPHQDREIDALERRWDRLVAGLEGASFPHFLRHHWNSRRPHVREKQLFRAVRDHVQNVSAVFDLLLGLEEDVDVYAALHDPDDPLWSPAQADLVRALRTFRERQAYPVLLAGRRTFDDAQFTSLLRGLVAVTIRFNIVGRRRPSEQETAYAAIVRGLVDGKITSSAAALRVLAPIYIDDELFKKTFATLSLNPRSNAPVLRYILAMLDPDGSAMDPTHLSLEHVLPDADHEGWTAFTDREHQTLRHRLGNVVLLEHKANRKLGQAEYAEKRARYLESSVPATVSVAQRYAEWTPRVIEERQRAMAKAAAAVWRIPQLD